MHYWGTGRLGSVFSTVTSTSATSVGPVGVQTYKVRVSCDSATFILIDQAPIVTSANGTYLPANSPEYFSITPGQKVSFIQATASGNGYVTEVG